MTNVTVYNQAHESVGDLELADAVFGAPVKEHLLHTMVRKQLAARRQGTHAVKRRADVRGGGRKPWRQKGTGRARQGTIRAPHWAGGGVVFGPETRSYDFKVNKKERRAALKGALTLRASQGNLHIVDELSFDAPKTKAFLALLESFGLDSVLVVLPEGHANIELSARNLPKVTVLPPQGVNVYDILNHTSLLATKDAISALSARLGGA